MCQFSIDYLTDKQDLDVIINHMAQVWTNKNSFELLLQLHQSVSKCTAINSQHNPKISDIKETDADTMHVCEFIDGFNYEDLPKISKSTRKSNCFEESFDKGPTSQPKPVDEFDFSPSNNVF